MVLIKPEIKTAILKGLGFYPTHYALRWSPTLKNPVRFDLLELQRCETDGGLLNVKNNSQAFLRLHAGHRLKDPVTFGLWEFLLIQARIIS